MKSVRNTISVLFIVCILACLVGTSYSGEKPDEDAGLAKRSTPASSKPESAEPQILERLLPLSNSQPRADSDKVTHVVIHFISNVVAKPDDPYRTEDILGIFKEYGVSAHYIIARDGTISRLVDETRNAYHAGKGQLDDYPSYTNKLNRHSIGIEIMAIGTQDEMKQYLSPDKYAAIPSEMIGYTDKQYEALASLLPGIFERHNINVDRTHVIGHDEYSVGRKRDPGSLFDWKRIGF